MPVALDRLAGAVPRSSRSPGSRRRWLARMSPARARGTAMRRQVARDRPRSVARARADPGHRPTRACGSTRRERPVPRSRRRLRLRRPAPGLHAAASPTGTGSSARRHDRRAPPVAARRLRPRTARSRVRLVEWRERHGATPRPSHSPRHRAPRPVHVAHAGRGRGPPGRLPCRGRRRPGWLGR